MKRAAKQVEPVGAPIADGENFTRAQCMKFGETCFMLGFEAGVEACRQQTAPSRDDRFFAALRSPATQALGRVAGELGRVLGAAVRREP